MVLNDHFILFPQTQFLFHFGSFSNVSCRVFFSHPFFPVFLILGWSCLINLWCSELKWSLIFDWWLSVFTSFSVYLISFHFQANSIQPCFWRFCSSLVSSFRFHLVLYFLFFLFLFISYSFFLSSFLFLFL